MSMVKQELSTSERANCTMTQSELNKLFEQPQLNFSLKYCSKIKSFYVSCFFFYILPIGPFITLLFMLVQYWVDKYLILRRYKKPPRLGKELSLSLAEKLEIGLVLLVAGTMLLKWNIHHTIDKVDIACIIITLMVFLTPIAPTVALAVSVQNHISKPRVSPTVENVYSNLDQPLYKDIWTFFDSE